MSSPSEHPLIPSEHVESICQLVKETTSVPFFHLTIDERRTPGLCDTKLGGLPYWPAGRAYPANHRGVKLMLLAQLRLTDLAGCNRLPDHGLLQFFIDSDDDCSGMDFDDSTNQDGFRVIWHEEVDPAVTADAVRTLDMPTSLDQGEDFLGNPLCGTYALDVTTGTSFITPAVEGFDEVFLSCARQVLGEGHPSIAGQDDWYDCLARPDSDKVFDLLSNAGPLHQVLGWPFFTQTDPRWEERFQDLDTLLLQVDSEGTGGKDRVLWGDVGIGNFFINGEALRRGDFSRVLFNWDCY